MKQRAMLVPCSGIGKVHGLIAREAVYYALEQLAPQEAGTLCLGLIVTGDEETVASARGAACIAIDGCPKLCSLKNVELAGGQVVSSVRVVDALKEHKGAQPGNATSLTEDGWTIVAEMGEDLVKTVRCLEEGARKGL